jgi:hypothetical protein
VTTSHVHRDAERDDCQRAPTLDHCLRAVVEEAVRSHMHREDAYLVFDDTEAIRRCLRALNAHAGLSHLRVERLIILLKQTAEAHPAAQAIIRTPGGERVVSQLVALLIDEFYRKPERQD